MDGIGVRKAEHFQKAGSFHKCVQGIGKCFGIKGKALAHSVISALRYVKMFTQRQDSRELPGQPGIEECCDKSQAVREIGDYDRRKQGMCFLTGRTQEGMNVDGMAAYRIVRIADKMAQIGAIVPVSGRRCITGRAAGSFQGKRFLHAGINIIIIEMFHFVKGLANI